MLPGTPEIGTPMRGLVQESAMIRNLAAGQTGMTSNVFLVPGERTVLVDVGGGFDVVSEVRDHVDHIDAVVLTHTHYDHVDNIDEVRAAFDVESWGYDPDHEAVDHELGPGDDPMLGDHAYGVLHTPGHKDDHLCLYSPKSGVLFAGDLVFANGGFGRTDLAEGDRATLVDSIERLLEFVDENLSVVHTGHGPSIETTPRQDIELALQAARMGV